MWDGSRGQRFSAVENSSLNHGAMNSNEDLLYVNVPLLPPEDLLKTAASDIQAWRIDEIYRIVSHFEHVPI